MVFTDHRVLDVGRGPKSLRNFERVDFDIHPPCFLVANFVKLTMVCTAQRHGELIAYLLPERSWLGVTDVVGVGRLPCTDEARLRGHKLQMGFIA